MNDAFRDIGESGLKASCVGIGTWAIGGEGWGGTDETAAIGAIQAALDNGINLIDTAPIYGFGLSEEIVGKAIAGRRDQVILATKCGLVLGDTRGDFFFPSSHGPIHRFLGKDSIFKEVEESLSRLKTDYIDLYQTHWQETTTPLHETMEALLELKQQGKIRAIGVSNVDATQLSHYVELGLIASVQELYSMVDLEKDADVIPLCIDRKIGFLAYSPLALGLLTGKIKPGQDFVTGDFRGVSKRFNSEAVAAVNRFLEEIEPIAREHNITKAQLVIGWTLSRPGISHVLCGVRTAAQAAENAVPMRLNIEPGVWSEITEKLAAHQLNVPKAFS